MINKYFTVLGIDPSISHVGVVYGLFDADTREFFPLVIQSIANKSTPSDHPDFNPTEFKEIKSFEIAEAIKKFISTKYRAYRHDIEIRPDLLIFELSNGSGNSFADASLNCAKGMISGIFAEHEKSSIVMPSPIKVKKITGNSRKAIKEQIIAWAVQKYGIARLEMKTEEFEAELTEGESVMCHKAPYGSYETLSYNEHIADAVAIVEAGLNDLRTKKWIEKNKDKAKSKDTLAMNLEIEAGQDNVRLFREELKKPRCKLSRSWEEQETAFGMVFAPSIKDFSVKVWGGSGRKFKAWDDWITRRSYGDACKYESRKISLVFDAFQTREIFFTDAFIIGAIQELGYLKFLSFFGLFELNYENRIEERIEIFKDNLLNIKKERISISESLSEDDKIKSVSEWIGKKELRKNLTLLKENIQEIQSDEKKFLNQSLPILEHLFEESSIKYRLQELEEQVGENPKADYRSYFLAERELLNGLLNNARIAQKGAEKLRELKKSIPELVEKALEACELKGMRVNADTLELEKVEKKKAGRKPKEKSVVAPDAQIVPKRGRGRPKGSKNKKTLEREKAEAMRKEREEGGSPSLAPDKEIDLSWLNQSNSPQNTFDPMRDRVARDLDEFLRELDHSED
ncbi:hypothetical protein [Parasutterella excrementihominis]|uniref:hypothetical protein n=1 Tax=Parasutterella excrementihominis TaxID=487175 RepID=UPI00266B762E|nr:hypothetical protein [Parasutterella excrementihominis]